MTDRWRELHVADQSARFRLEPSPFGEVIVTNPRSRSHDQHYWEFRHTEDEDRWRTAGSPGWARWSKKEIA